MDNKTVLGDATKQMKPLLGERFGEVMAKVGAQIASMELFIVYAVSADEKVFYGPFVDEAAADEFVAHLDQQVHGYDIGAYVYPLNRPTPVDESASFEDIANAPH